MTVSYRIYAVTNLLSEYCARVRAVTADLRCKMIIRYIVYIYIYIYIYIYSM